MNRAEQILCCFRFQQPPLRAPDGLVLGRKKKEMRHVTGSCLIFSKEQELGRPEKLDSTTHARSIDGQ
jgi:hypothetical protein